MKTTLPGFKKILALALTGLAGTGWLAAQSNTPMTAVVTRIQGAARYWPDGAGQVHLKLKKGTRLPAGAVVQTAANGVVDFSLEAAQTPARAATNRKLMRLYENSVLALDQLQAGAAREPHIRLDLRAGEIIAQTSHRLPEGGNSNPNGASPGQPPAPSGEFTISTASGVLGGIENIAPIPVPVHNPIPRLLSKIPPFIPATASLAAIRLPAPKR